ncbi:uncharacterized protein PV09_05117 [Verruconis gallopava]|uniref:PH domain-containing protein n=1 Tax=Verruconis gallopava TaxID=253628 RepID=A0A0D1YT53_9PEZI|nr:uncharacterized protein PV09_05117 [Verruconis gallopava]KIW03817.1 hypothetical protein PV09_05117 [Verruconis gallopava]
MAGTSFSSALTSATVASTVPASLAHSLGDATQPPRHLAPYERALDTKMRPDSATTTATTTTAAGTNAAAANVQARKTNNGLAIRTFSPVNKNGCFEFDRVLKSGNVLKRTRKTKSWKPIHMVLRPLTLSLYADSDGTKLRHQIPLADLTAVARQRDPKKKERHVFALFTPERNYHIEAPSDAEARSWVETIRSQARIGEEEDEFVALLSPTVEAAPGGAGMDSGFFGPAVSNTAASHVTGETSASDIESHVQPLRMKKSRSRNNLGTTPETAEGPSNTPRKSSLGMQYLSGAEAASYSDFSDTGGGGGTLGSGVYPESTLSLPQLQSQAEREERARKLDEIYRPSAQRRPSTAATGGTTSGATAAIPDRPPAQRSASGLSTSRAQQAAPSERVLHNSPLLLLKTRAGTRQWKSVWAVLRNTSLALYKNEEEYQPLHIIPFESVVEALDIEDLSKSKRHCFMVVTEERQLKFCARSEEEVAKWVGGFKALLAKRREAERGRDGDGNVLSSSPVAVR